jgi:vesicle coat complex subunit
MERELEKFVEIVEDMILQLSYPGFDERSLKLGLPDSISKFPPKTYANALKIDSTVVKLAAIRWYQERPGIAKSHLKSITECLTDKDDWVRKEAVLCLEKIEHVDENVLLQICALLKDEDIDVRKYTAKALGKLGGKSQAVIEALQAASEDSNHEVRWKIQKALRKLGAYVA